MPSKHYKWQARWQLDWAAGLAVHDSGLSVSIDNGVVAVDPAHAAQIRAQLEVKNGPHNAPAMMRRLEREAQQLVKEHGNARR